ncbi:MAG: hypothetical protein ABJO27_00170 [Pseudoruegeria sp.]
MLKSRFPNAMLPMEFGNRRPMQNRLFFSSMGLDLCDGDGLPKPDFFKLYESLIEGGCGFGFLCNASVDLASRYNSKGLKIVSERHAEALAPLIDFARSRGVSLGVQLQHYGAQAADADATTPSPRMSEEAIEDCIGQFVRAALLARKAGAPMVQLQAANGYLLSSFLSPYTNHRTDAWGGTPTKRARLVVTIVDRILQATQGDLAVSIRLGIDDGLGDVGQQPAFLTQVVQDLEQAGVASIECSVGLRKTFGSFFSDNDKTLEILRNGCRLLGHDLRIPIGFTGSVVSVAQADEIIGAGDADFVGFARAVLADNQLVAKELAGDFDAVHRCLGDAFCFRDKKETTADRVFCCVNPAYPRPKRLQDLYEDGLR